MEDIVLDNILARTSIRSYQDRPVEQDKIEKLLRAGMAAPSAVDKRPWHFIVVTDHKVLEGLAEANPNAGMAARAPLAIVVCGDKTKALTRVPDYWVQDVAEARFTHEVIEKSDYFTIMTFKDQNVLRYMGSHSGRDGDKAAALGLHVAYTDNGTPYYKEAECVVECKIMYSQPFDPANFKDEVPREFYDGFFAGYHTLPEFGIRLVKKSTIEPTVQGKNP